MTRPTAHTLIVGAGVVGLMVAYHLARRGAGPILVLDAAPALLMGASGRNGGGVRAQWTTRENIDLARRSIAAFDRLARQTGHNTWFRQGGYLFLARDQEMLRRLERARRFQNQHGVHTRMLSAQEARRIVPQLDLEGVVGATFNPDDGTLFPWPVVHGLAERCRALGVDIMMRRRVEAIGPVDDSLVRVRTNVGDFAAQNVVVAAGAWSRDVVASLGVTLPTRPERHEILVTEAIKPFLDPMVVDLSNGLYVSQAMRGELVGGMGRPHPEGHDQDSSFEFISHFARALVRLMPSLSGLNVLRQWAGSYDVTPDARPILGRVGRWSNIFVGCGFSGHGFMLSPAVGQMTADMILDGRTDYPIEKFSLERFARGDLEMEEMVIG